MTNSIANKIKAIAGWKSFVAAFIVYMIFGGYIMPQGVKTMSELSNQDIEILDLQFSYTPEKAENILSKYSQGAHRYAIQFGLIADTIYPLVYTFLFIVIIAWIYKLPTTEGTKFNTIHLFPVSILVVDYFENIGIASLHYSYPNLSNNLVYVSSSLTTLKWSLVIVAIVIAVVGIGRRFRANKRAN